MCRLRNGKHVETERDCCFSWTPQDSRDWEALTGNERHFINMVLAFFAASDGIVMENLVSYDTVMPRIAHVRAHFFFSFSFSPAICLVCPLAYGQVVSFCGQRAWHCCAWPGILTSCRY